MKRILTLTVTVLLVFALAGCSGGEPTASTKTEAAAVQVVAKADNPPDLIGNWKQSNSGSDTDYMVAVVAADMLEVYWIMQTDDTQALYWSGSFAAPTAADEPYSWVSKADHAKTDSAMLASTDDTKEFSYNNDELSCTVSIMGTTKTVKFIKTTDDVLLTPVQASGSAFAPATDAKKEYAIGETWTVDGQWSLTVDSIEETADRNEYEDRKPAAVYIVTYTYTNLGYEDSNGIMNGLYLAMDSTVVDSAGKMGYSYPGDVTYYPQETPVGATCTGQCCIGVENPGAIKIHVAQYDGNDNEQKAIFAVAP